MAVPRALGLALCLAIAVLLVQSEDSPAPHLNLLDLYEKASHSEHMDAVTDVVKSELRNGYKIEMVGNYTVKQMVELFVETVKRSEHHGKTQFEKGWSSFDDYICLALKGCHGHGKCMGMKGGCKCKTGFGDLDCSETLSDSRSCSRDCSDNGACIAHHGKAPYCKCEEGWGGPSCRVPVCARRCTKHGRCEVHIPLSASCNCDDGFAGNDCSVKVPKAKKKRAPSDVSLTEDPASDVKHKGAAEPNGEVEKVPQPKKPLQPISCPNNCSGANGYCSDSEKICYCKAGFTGPDCSVTQKCPEKCDERGKCIDGVCYCLDGYSGADCSKESFRCPDNCSGHGTCEKDTCLCDKGYEGSNCALRHAGGQPLNVLGEVAETNPHTPPEIEYKVEGKEVDQEAPKKMDTAAQAEEQVRKNPDPRPKLEEAEAETYTIPGEENKVKVTKKPNVSIARKSKDDQEAERAKDPAGSTMSMEENLPAKKASPAEKEEPVVRFDHAAAISPESGHVGAVDASAVLASAGSAGAKMTSAPAPAPAPAGPPHAAQPIVNKVVKGASAAVGSAPGAHDAAGTVVNNDQVPAHVTSEQEKEFQDAEHNLKRTVHETQGASEAKAKLQDSVIQQNAANQDKKMDSMDNDAHKMAADSASTINNLAAQVNKVKAVAEGDEALAKAELERAEKDMDQHLEDNQASVRRAREEQEKKSDTVNTELVESNQEHTSVENNMQNEINQLKAQMMKQSEQHIAAMNQESHEVQEARAAEVEAKKEMAEAITAIKKEEEVKDRLDTNNAEVEATAQAQKQQAQENADRDALRASEGAREASAIINQSHQGNNQNNASAPITSASSAHKEEQAKEVKERAKLAADKAKLTKQEEEDAEAEKEEQAKDRKEEEEKDAADLNKEYDHDDPKEIQKDKEEEGALAAKHRDQEEAMHKTNQQKEDELKKSLDIDTIIKEPTTPLTPPKGAADPSDKLDKVVADMMENSHSPGLSTFMGTATRFFGNGRVAHSFNTKTSQSVDVSAQPLNDKSAHMIASVSKTITWTALSMLMDKGAFDLDDDINDHLDFSVRNPSHADVKVTFRQLYSHHTGIRDPSGDALDATYGYNADECASINAADKLEDFLKSYLSTKGAWGTTEPGSKENYSNVATGLAGLLVEKISKMPFKDFCKQHIFDFLGMSSTAWTVPDLPSSAELVVPYRWDNDQARYTQRGPFYCFVDYPSGQLYTTASDAARFFRAAANHGMSPDKKDTCLYSRYTGQLAFQKSMGTWGLGWSLTIVDSYPSCPGHNGGEYGTSTLVLLCPSTQGGGRVAGAFANIEDAELNPVVKQLMDNHADVPAPGYGNDCTNTWKNPKTPEDETPEHQEKEGIKDHNTAEQTHAENAETKSRENASKIKVEELKNELKAKTSTIEDELQQEKQKIDEEEKKQLAEAAAQADHAENDAKLEIQKAEHDAKSKITDVEKSSKQHAASADAGHGLGVSDTEAAIAAAEKEAAIVKEEAAKEVAAVKEKVAVETSASKHTEQVTVESAKKHAAIEEHAAVQEAAEKIKEENVEEAAEEATVDQEQAKASAAVNNIDTNSDGSSHEAIEAAHQTHHEEHHETHETHATHETHETHETHSVGTSVEGTSEAQHSNGSTASEHPEHSTNEQVHEAVVDHTAEVSSAVNATMEKLKPEESKPNIEVPHEANATIPEESHATIPEESHATIPGETHDSNATAPEEAPHVAQPEEETHTSGTSPGSENKNATEISRAAETPLTAQADIISEVKQPVEAAPEDLSWSSGSINAPKMKSTTTEATSTSNQHSSVKSTASGTTSSSNDVAAVSTGSESPSSTSSGKGLHSLWAKVMLGVIAATTLAVVVGMAVISMWKREVIPATHRDNFTSFMA